MPEVVKLRITAHNALVSETIVFAGHPFWLRVPSTAPDSLMPVRVETQHVWVPMFDSPEPSLDRRRLAVKVFEKTVTPLQSLGGQAECELKLQFREGDWEGTWCRTPGRLPAALHAGDGEQGFRVAAPIVDANHPVDVWIQKGLEKLYVVVVRDNSWQNMGRVVSGQEISLLASRSGLSSDGGELQFAWGRRSSHNP